MSRRTSKITGQFVAHLVEMRLSPAWQALRGTDKLALERIELEHVGHGGQENGQLVVTFSDLAKHGVDRKAVAGCLARLEALGFVVCECRGRASAAEFRHPSRYRVTYLPGNTLQTDEWRRVADAEDAQHRIERALKALRERTVKLRKSLAKKRSGEALHSSREEDAA